MPKKETVFEYKVTGFRPFPLDMLRRDQANGATVEDKALIALLSTDTVSKETPEKQSFVTLHGTSHPSRKRWESFKWIVAGSVNQIEIERPYTDEEKLALLAELAEMRKAADERLGEVQEHLKAGTAAKQRAATARAELALANKEEEEAEIDRRYAFDEHKSITEKIDETLRSLAE